MRSKPVMGWAYVGTRASRSALDLVRCADADANGKPFGDVRVPRDGNLVQASRSDGLDNA